MPNAIAKPGRHLKKPIRQVNLRLLGFPTFYYWKMKRLSLLLKKYIITVPQRAINYILQLGYCHCLKQ